MLAPGATLGRYSLLTRLRSGGMATLYLGKRVGAAGFARPVAIKVIHPHLAEDPRFVRMFVDEATLSAKIDDPHVVHVEELGEADGTYFLVMEYVDGVSLAEMLRDLGRRKRALSVELVSWVAMQVAAGLHAAHEATNEAGEPLGLVHRDVSPHNVLLAFKGHVKLIDFGIAKARTRPAETQTGSLRGKIAYMPPEQAFGRSVDRRADVYALGVVLWEMLTMRRLFDAENDLALLERVRRPEIMRPGGLVPGIPPALDDVVMTALAPDVEARFASAEELRAAIGRAVPAASGKTARDLAAVLGAVMPDAIKRGRDRLADALGEADRGEAAREPPEPQPSADDALATMTVTMPDAAILFESDDAGPRVARPFARPTTTRARETRSRGVPIVVGIGGAALVALLTAAGWSLRGARTEAPPAADTGSLSFVPISTVSSEPGPPASAGEPRVIAPPPAVATQPAGAPAHTSTGVRRARPSKHGAPSAASSPPASSVELHGDTPFFKRGDGM